MIKGVIFDLDGLLIDSEPYWREGDFLLAKKYNFPLTDEFRKQLMGRGIKECSELLIKNYHLKVTADDLTRDRLNFLYQTLFGKVKLMPFAKELIQKLKNNGYVLAVATAGHEASIAQKILDQLSILNYFPFIVSGLEVKHSKPAPDIFLETAKRMELLPDECIVFEDAINGVIAAKAAGMKVIGVQKDKEVIEGFKREKADFIYEDLKIPLDIFQS